MSVDARWFPCPLLAIESSCDETAAAVLVGRDVRSNVISSQIDLHQATGGVVPEVAARAHVEAILPVVERALLEAGIGLDDIEGIAVANRPGLLGALSIGVTFAKALSFAKGLPIIGAHHLEGHALSPFFEAPDLPFPHLCLLVSGGHTELIETLDLGRYRALGQTIDDAAGEAFDKSARALGFAYPGGRALSLAAQNGRADRYKLPQSRPDSGPYDWSFSGLKTAVVRLVEREGQELNVPDAAASIESAIVGALVERTMQAVDDRNARALTLAGGVAANQTLRDRLSAACSREGVRFVAAPLAYCTDNAAMIGLAGSFRLARGERDGLSLDCFATADLPGREL